MTYYLARKNVREIADRVFGDDLKRLGFGYNRKYKYWYHVTKNGIIQFLGMSRYSGGRYDLSFLCQPLFVPILTSFVEDKRGVVPSFEGMEGTVVLSNMMELGMLQSANVPRLRGVGDPLELIERHMRITFDNVVKPVFEKSRDVSSCYQEYLRIQAIRSRIIRGGSYEAWKEWRYSTCALELFSLLYMRKYEEALKTIEGDSEIRRMKHITCVFDQFVPMIQERDEAAISRYLAESQADTVAELRKYEFDIVC